MYIFNLFFRMPLLIITIITIISIMNYAGLIYAELKLDSDKDGLRDDWEKNGIDINNDTIVDLDLPSLGANYLHKDIFLEIDYMKFHKPIQAAIKNVIEAFDNSPLTNPDNKTGISLHILVDDEIPHKNKTSYWNEFEDLKNNFLGTINERESSNHEAIIDAKRNIFHYAIFAHGYSEYLGSSGVSDMPSFNSQGMNFMITLGIGSIWSVNPETNHTTGNRIQQEGTLMHELGHNLGLDHAGNTSLPHYKPNYISVMNYGFQIGSLVPNRQLDYSRCEFQLLNENALNEEKGIIATNGTICFEPKSTFTGPLPIQQIMTAEPVDWNRDGDINDLNIKSDITCSKNCDNLFEPLHGFDDWDNIKFTIPHVNLQRMSVNNESIFVKELSSEDVIGHQKSLLQSIQDEIQNLGNNDVIEENLNDTQLEQTKDIFENTLINETNTNSLSNLLKQPVKKNIDKSINSLNKLKNITASTSDGELFDNLIIIPQKNAKIVSKIDRLIHSLENLKY